MQLGGHSSKRDFGRKCHTNQRFRDNADDCLTTSAVNMAILCTPLERNYLFAYPRRPSLLPGNEVLKSLETDHFPRVQVSLDPAELDPPSSMCLPASPPDAPES